MHHLTCVGFLKNVFFHVCEHTYGFFSGGECGGGGDGEGEFAVF